MEPVDAQHWVRDEMTKIFPLGVFRDRTAEAAASSGAAPAPALEDMPRLLEIASDARDRARPRRRAAAGLRSADQGRGFRRTGRADAGRGAGRSRAGCRTRVSWLPSYGPEMRSGTSNCHVRLSTHAIDSPLVSRPNVLLALNEPSLRKFVASVEPGGWVFYNGEVLPDDVQPRGRALRRDALHRDRRPAG